jgi:cysteine desulfurase/selenocysteine lyase
VGNLPPWDAWSVTGNPTTSVVGGCQHGAILDHHRNSDATAVTDPTFVKSSEETTCGDDGEFYVEIGADGTIANLGFESESCAVSSAVASILGERIVGMSVDDVPDIEGLVVELLDGQFSDLRHECVTGPEKVLVEGVRDYIDEHRRTTVSD